MQGPDTYLRELGITLPCAVHAGRPAVLDAEHRVFVNWEAFYVSDAGARTAFEAAPYRYAGRLTDPVSRERFTAGETSPRRDFGERIYYFASAQTLAKFDADPDAYSTPMPGMMEKR